MANIEAKVAAAKLEGAVKEAAKAAEADEEKDKIVHALMLQKKAAEDKAAKAIAEAATAVAEAATAEERAVKEMDLNASLVAAKQVAEREAEQDKAAFALAKAASEREAAEMQKELEQAKAKVKAAEAQKNNVVALLAIERKKKRAGERDKLKLKEAKKLKDAQLGASAAGLLAEIDADRTAAATTAANTA